MVRKSAVIPTRTVGRDPNSRAAREKRTRLLRELRKLDRVEERRLADEEIGDWPQQLANVDSLTELIS